MDNVEKDSTPSQGYDLDLQAQAILAVKDGNAPQINNPAVADFQRYAQGVQTQQAPNDEPPVDQPGANDEGQPPVANEPEEQEYELTQEDVLGLLSQAGVNAQSLEDIQEALRIKEEVAKNSQAYSGLSKEEQAMIASYREYGDVNYYGRIMGIQTDALPEKEILRQSYLLKHSDTDVALASRLFEREYTKKYEEEEDEEIARLLLKRDTEAAIKDIKSKQEEISGKTIGAASQPEVQDTSAQDQVWFQKVDEVLGKYNSIAFPIDDKTEVSIAMDQADVEAIKQGMDQPIEFIKSFILNDSGQVDYDRLYEFVMRNYYFETILAEAAITSKSVTQEEALKEARNPHSSSVPRPLDAHGDEQRDHIAKAFGSFLKP